MEKETAKRRETQGNGGQQRSACLGRGPTIRADQPLQRTAQNKGKEASQGTSRETAKCLSQRLRGTCLRRAVWCKASRKLVI